jgi:hypothetical protein
MHQATLARTSAPLSAGYQFLRGAREWRSSPSLPTPPRNRRIETQVWIWLTVVPCSALLLQTLGGILRGVAGPYSLGFVVATIVWPSTILWALIGGARVERMPPRWASFHVGLSAGTALVTLFALRHFGVLVEWVSERVLGVFSSDRLDYFGVAAAFLSVWLVLYALALPLFATLDVIRGVRAVRGAGLGKLAIEFGAIGAALATATWWIPWP